MDPEIAHGPVIEGNVPGHNKYDLDYSLGRYEPDIIVSNVSTEDTLDPSKLEALSHGDYAFSGRLFKSSTFQQHYAANRLNVGFWKALYLRNDSAEADWLTNKTRAP
jgi:hypothetical protein